MSGLELAARALAKLALIAGVVLLFFAACTLESGDCAGAVRLGIIGTAVSVPDIVIWRLDGLH